MSTSVFSKLRTTVSFRLFDLRRWFTADCTSLRSIALNSVNAVELPISLEWFSLCVEISVSRSLSSVKKRKFHYQTIHTPFSLELVTLLNYECIELRRRCPDSLSFLFYLWLFVLFFCCSCTNTVEIYLYFEHSYLSNRSRTHSKLHLKLHIDWPLAALENIEIISLTLYFDWSVWIKVSIELLN